MELTLKEVEVTKLNLQPGEVLTVTVKSDDIDQEGLGRLREMFKELFPNNQVAVFGLNNDDTIKFSIIQSVQDLTCNTENYCADCDCGKKEVAENPSGETL